MKKLDSVQSMAQTLLDKLGPVKRIFAQKLTTKKNWRLEDLLENLQKYVKVTPLQPGGKRNDK